MSNYDFNDLGELLRSGTDPEEIAKAFSDNLNKAIADSTKSSREEKLLVMMAEAWNEYINLQDFPDDMDLHMTPSDLKVAIDTLLELFVKTAPLMSMMEELANGFEPKKPRSHRRSVEKGASDEYDEVIGDFLSKYCK